MRAEYSKLDELKKKYDKLEQDYGKCTENFGESDVIPATPVRNKVNKALERATLVKSPSDTTIYAPALMKSPEKDLIIDKIANFADEMRSQHRESTTKEKEGSSFRDKEVEREQVSDDYDSHNLASKLVLEAEQYKAVVEQPQGKNTLPGKINELSLSDDDFFHLVCHVDANTRTKIENGHYVDLEKNVAKR